MQGEGKGNPILNTRELTGDISHKPSYQYRKYLPMIKFLATHINNDTQILAFLSHVIFQ